MKYLIGIDIGTSATKSVLFDTEGNVIASASVEYPLLQPQNGWAEQHPEDWWGATVKTLRELSLHAKDGEIAGIGLSGQMHGLVMLNEKDEVIRPAIIWCDGRTGEECEDIERLVGRERLIEITANPALTGFTASKIMWVKKHEPEHFARCRHILLPKDYIRFKLTGEFATEVSDASGMQLLDVKRRAWSEEVCDRLGIDMSLLARMHESPEITGRVTAEVSALTDIPAGTVVAGGAGDNAAAAIGTGVCEDGRAFTTVGTSGVVFAHTDRPVIDPQGRIHTFCCAVPGCWHVMGVVQSAGLSLNWFKRTLAEHMSYREIDEAASALPIGSDRLIYLPYLMGERTPLLDSDARGVFFGLSARHTRAHMARAVLEGVAFSLRSCLDVLQEMEIQTTDMAVCGGGAKSALWRSMIADVYGISVKTMASDEGPALGAAILGGCAAGVYASVKEGCERAVRIGETTAFDATRHETYMRYHAIYDGLYPCLKASFKQLAKQ